MSGAKIAKASTCAFSLLDDVPLPQSFQTRIRPIPRLFVFVLCPFWMPSIALPSPCVPMMLRMAHPEHYHHQRCYPLCRENAAVFLRPQNHRRQLETRNESVKRDFVVAVVPLDRIALVELVVDFRHHNSLGMAVVAETFLVAAALQDSRRQFDILRYTHLSSLSFLMPNRMALVVAVVVEGPETTTLRFRFHCIYPEENRRR